MKNLIITSAQESIGKTTFSIALAMRLKKEGYNVGYFKPITSKQDDEDATYAKTMLNMKEDLKIIEPVVISEWEYDTTDDEIEAHKKKILTAYTNLKKSYDFLLIESARTMKYLSFLHLSARELAQMLDATILLLVSGEIDENFDNILLADSYFNDINIPLVGAVLTLVSPEILERFKTIISPILQKRHKLEILGLIPNRQQLTAPTVGEVAGFIGAKFLYGKDHAHKLVEDYQIGAMEPESALKFFRKTMHQAVITGGDRPALALAAMETDISCLILTGGIYPPATVLSRAEEKNIPLLLVAGQTYDIVKQLTVNPLRGVIHPDQKEKITEWDKVIDKIAYSKIIEKLKT